MRLFTRKRIRNRTGKVGILKKGAFICAAAIVMLLSVAYATLNIDLSATGSLSLNSQDGVVMTDANIAANGLVGSNSDANILYYASTILKNRIQLDQNGDSYVILAIEVENTYTDAYKFDELVYEKSASSTTYTNQYIVPTVLSKTTVSSIYPSVNLNGVIELGDTIAAGATKTFYVKFSYDKTGLGNHYNSSTNTVEIDYTILATATIDYSFVPLYTFTYANSYNSESKTTRFSMVDKINVNFSYSASPSSEISSQYTVENAQKVLNLTIQTNKLPWHIAFTGFNHLYTNLPSSNSVSMTFTSITGNIGVYYRPFHDGSGSSSNPYLIGYVEDLVELSTLVAGGDNFSGKYFKLNTNLNLTSTSSYRYPSINMYGDVNRNNSTESTLMGELTNSQASGFYPIGTQSVKFAGSFNGDSKKISELYINNSTLGAVGLFGSVNSATISNLTVDGSITTSVSSYSGGIVGSMYGTTTLSNVTNKANITATSDGNHGGIVGLNGESANSVIDNASNSGSVSGGTGSGGIIGCNNATIEIKNSVNTGEISNTIGRNAGGIIASDNLATNVTKISNCHNRSGVWSNMSTQNMVRIGGIMGAAFGKVDIDGSYNTAIIQNKRTSYTSGYDLYVGGIIGEVATSGNRVSTIKTSYNTGRVVGGNRTGGIIGLKYGDSVLIIDEVYNSGEVYTNTKAGTYTTTAGGILAYVYNGTNNKAYILNSYNTNTVTVEVTATSSVFAGGLVGGNYKTLMVLNSYNTGNVFGNGSLTGGLFAYTSDASVFTINNCYNKGSVTGDSSKYSVGYMSTSATRDIANIYYINSANATNISSVNSTLTATSNFNASSFVSALNTNTTSAKGKFTSDLTGYKLRLWKTGTSNAEFNSTYAQ